MAVDIIRAVLCTVSLGLLWTRVTTDDGSQSNSVVKTVESIIEAAAMRRVVISDRERRLDAVPPSPPLTMRNVLSRGPVRCRGHVSFYIATVCI